MAEHADRGSVVLVALDGSPAAATAVPIARTIAAQLGAHVEVLHVLRAGMPAPDPNALLGPAADQGSLPVRFATGDPATEILRAGEAPEVTLLVMATHGHEVHPGRLLAPIPQAVIAGTSRPVLLVRPEAVTAPVRPFRRLLFPLDGTPTTTDALAPAAQIAARLQARIDVLFVVFPGQTAPAERGTMLPPSYVDQPQYEWPAWQARVAKWLRCHCADLPPDTEIHTYLARSRSQAEIGEVIAAFASAHAEDGIVLVRRSHLETGRALILRAVLEHTPCPVLLVAARAAESAPIPAPASAGSIAPANR